MPVLRDEHTMADDIRDLGAALKSKREGLGLSLEDVERDTKIRRAFLAAIEEGDYSAIPGMVYARGFVRNYCDYLGLSDLWPRFDGLLKGEESPTLGAYAQPRTVFRRSSRWWLYLILVGAVALAMYLIFQQWQDFKARVQESRITKTAEVSQSPGGGADVSIPLSADHQAVSSDVPMPSQPAPAASADVSGASSRGEVSSTDVLSHDLSWMNGSGQVNGASQEVPVPSGVTVAAIKTCWLKVTDISDRGRTLFQGTLNAGESRSFSSEGVLRIRLGNAGAAMFKTLSVEINPAGPMGVPKTYYVLPDGTVDTKRPKDIKGTGQPGSKATN